MEELKREGVAGLCAVRMDVRDEASIKAGIGQVRSIEPLCAVDDVFVPETEAKVVDAMMMGGIL